MTLWEDESLIPVIDDVPIDQPITEQEKIILRWLELGMEGDVIEIIFPEGKFTVDINNAAYGKKRGDPIKVKVDHNGEQKVFVYVRNKFTELKRKYESDKSESHWNDYGTKMPNDLQEVPYTGVVTWVDLEGGYYVVMPDSSIIPGEMTIQPMVLVNWDDHIDKQVEGTRVTGVALILRDRVSFMSGIFVHGKTMEYEVSTN